MKNKKIYLILFAVALFAIMLFASSTDVHASDTNYALKVETTINNWQQGSALLFVKVDDWADISCEDGDFKYNKTVYLQKQGEATQRPITRTVKLSDYDGDFSTGDTVKLVEVYTFTSVSPEIDVEKSFSIDSNDYLTLGTLNNEGEVTNKWSTLTTSWKKTYANSVFSNYDDSTSVTAYYDCFYESAYKYYFYFNDGTNKTVTKSKGTVDMLSLRVYADFSVSGNLVGPDSYYWYISPSNSSSFGNYTSSSTFEEVNTSQFDDVVNDHFTVYISGTPQVNNASTSFNYGTSWSDAHVSSVETSGDYMYVTLTQSGDFSVTPPNGIFYNILPFAVAGLVAIAGIVILKKNSIK